jgi:D-beta-D-heptose 7-phosphate kinase / D-beta-D-heptose 1-phosphate adenosyltransferase
VTRPHGQHELTAELPELLARRRPRVVVLGDPVLDVWLSGRADRLCREAPAPVVDVSRRNTAPGAAGNTAVNLAALGADVTMVAAVGDDRSGSELTVALAHAGVDVADIVAVPERATVTKCRVSAGDQLLLRFDTGTRAALPASYNDHLVGALSTAVEGCDALVICDYDLGVLSDRLVQCVWQLREHVPVLVVDAHHAGRWRAVRPDLVTPNAAEASALIGNGVPDDAADRMAFLEAHEGELLAATGAAAVVVTLDRDGAVVLAGNHPMYRTWARPAPDHHTAGAGDTFCAALTVALCAQLPLPVAAELGQAAADVVVHQPGTAICRTDQLAARLATYHDAVLASQQLTWVLAAARASGRRIVFTNGCFDVVHRGHVAYLNQAKRLGDVLVVAVNSDASVARLKGAERPVNTAADRAAVLAALSCVDYVTIFDEDTAVNLLRELRPDVYAKGGDYTPDMLVETPVVRAYGGEVHMLDYVPDQSTSVLIDRIRAAAVGS